MSRVTLGISCGIAFGLLDAAMVVFGKHPDKSLAMLLQAFFSRFAIGFLAANVWLRIHPVISGALVGLLISLPDAFAMKSYVGILGTGLIFGALAGCATKAGQPKISRSSGLAVILSARSIKTDLAGGQPIRP
jgi:hypothetical protein